MAKGAAATNQSIQPISTPRICLMKLVAIIFWAAAVLIPTFQMLSAWAVAIMRILAKRVFFSTPKAETIPITIGTIQATRAVVEGTKKLRAKPVRITPMRIRLVLAPTRESTLRAIRRSRPVLVIAIDRNKAAPTSAQAVLEKRYRPADRAGPVPSNAAGLATFGEKPSKTTIKDKIIAALAG